MRKRLFGNGGGANIDQIIGSITLQFSSEGYERVYWNYNTQDGSHRIFTEDYTSTGQIYAFQESYRFLVTIEQYDKQLTGLSPTMQIVIFHNDVDQLEIIDKTYNSSVMSLEVEDYSYSIVPNHKLIFSINNPGIEQSNASFSIVLLVNNDNKNLAYITGSIF